MDQKLEVIIIPVADVDRAKEFYGRLGWRLDATPPFVVQFTPPGSWCSVQFGEHLTSAAPGSGKGYLIVSDIDAIRNQLTAAGVEVSEVFHRSPDGPQSGPAPGRSSYGSFVSFDDPDGNNWLFQEVTTRLPGRVDVGAGVTFGSASDVADAMRRASRPSTGPSGWWFRSRSWRWTRPTGWPTPPITGSVSSGVSTPCITARRS